MPGPGIARRALPALLVAAVILPLLVLLISGVLAWRDAWRQAGAEALHTADAAAEYVGRVLDGQRMLVERVDDLLRGRSDAAIRAEERTIHDAMRRVLDGQAQDVGTFVLDRDGRLLVSSTRYPAPRDLSFADRDYVTALAASTDPGMTHVSKVVMGSLRGSTFFSISRRRSDPGNGRPAGSFDGLVSVSVYTTELHLGLRQLLNGPADNIGLARADGEVLAGTRGFSEPPPPLKPGSVRDAMARAERRTSVLAEPVGTWPERIVAVRQVAGWPVYALASRPRAEVLAEWRETMLPQLAVGLPASALLGLLALLVRRQQATLARAYHDLEQRVAERTAALAATEAEFRAAFDSAVMGKAQVDPATLRLTRVNARFAEILGCDAQALTGGTLLTELGLLEPGIGAAAAGDHPYHAERLVTRRDRSQAWVNLSCAGIRDGAGQVIGLLVAIQDITDRKQAEERQSLLAREVDHRAKNALAVVQAALRLTPKLDAASYAAAIEGRVRALARAQTLLAHSRWDGADLRALAAGELAAFLLGPPGSRQVELAGPPLSLPAAMTQPLSMTLHELATNAVKHGALSTPGGTLALRWWAEAGTLRLDWRERGGPALAGPPGRSGFGSRLLQNVVGRQLGGRLVLHWAAEGLHCELAVPLRGAHPPPAATAAAQLSL